MLERKINAFLAALAGVGAQAIVAGADKDEVSEKMKRIVEGMRELFPKETRAAMRDIRLYAIDKVH